MRWTDYVGGGVWGAVAAMFNKVALDFNETAVVLSYSEFLGHPLYTYAVRAILIALGIYCNGRMLKCYLYLLKHISALQATLAQFAGNTIASGLLGKALFGDMLSISWVLGATLLSGGVWCLTASSKSDGEVKLRD